MSTAVYYQQEGFGVEDYCKQVSSPSTLSNPATSHPLPQMVRMMPLNQQHLQQQYQQQQYEQQKRQPQQIQQNLQAADMAQIAMPGSLYSMYGQMLPEKLSQPTPNDLNNLSVNTTPALSFPNSNYIASTMMLGLTVPLSMQTMGLTQPPAYIHPNRQEKCTCKSNPNRIPRPRNAFILFRQKYHQSVLDESTETKTNPEVSRELGRRWRALSRAEHDHWTNLAEEEKQNHAKKYPNYRYTPRRNGKNKNCPVCQLKNKRPVQMVQNHALYFTNQHDQSQLMALTAQKLPLAQQQMSTALVQQYVSQQQVLAPQSPHQQLHQLQLQLQRLQQLAQPGNSYMGQQIGQYMYTYPQLGQFGFSDQNGQSAQAGQQTSQGQQLQQALQVNHLGQQIYHHNLPKQSHQQQQQHYLASDTQMQFGVYDQGLAQQPYQQRFNSFPTPMKANSYAGHEVLATPSHLQH